MPMLITGALGYEEHGDCSELKRKINIYRSGLLYKADAFIKMDFRPINRGRFRLNKIKKDVRYYVMYHKFYEGYEYLFEDLPTLSVREQKRYIRKEIRQVKRKRNRVKREWFSGEKVRKQNNRLNYLNQRLYKLNVERIRRANNERYNQKA